MKNITLFLLCAGLNLFFFTANAQPNAGLKGGLNYTSLGSYDGNKRISLHAGVFVQVALNKKWSLQPELLYSAEGQHYTSGVSGDDHTESGKGTITLDYAALPLMLRFSPRPNFYMEAGPQLAVLIAAHSKGIGSDKMNMKRSFTNGQFGLNLGAGLMLNQRIGLYGRYNFGMTDINPYNTGADRSQAGQLGITFRLSNQRPAKEKSKEEKK